MIDVSPELAAFLREEYERCRDEALEDERATAIDRYNGEPYGDEEDGRSQVVARDTAETTDYMVISILRTFFSGDRVVEFVHRNSEAAHQATETIMHLFMDEQDGYQITHDWLKAGLLEKNAVCMTYGEPQPPRRKVVEGVSALALMAAEEQGAKIIEAEETGEPDEAEGPIYRVTLLEERPAKFRDAAIPNEEFYCSPDARTITEAALKGRKVRKSISDLVRMGLELEELETIASDSLHDGLLDDARGENRAQRIEDRKGPNRLSCSISSARRILRSSRLKRWRMRRTILSRTGARSRCSTGVSASRSPTRRWTSSGSTRCCFGNRWTESISATIRELMCMRIRSARIRSRIC
jgi:hypothetical protein